jgi:hypothetical protein
LFRQSSAPFKTAAQLQAVAGTLTTLWFFEASACGSSAVNPGWQQVGGGATYLYSNVQSDALFLRLNGQPPSGAFFAGWDANAVSAGSAAVGIHHPQGDLKKVSQGSIIGFARWDATSTANQYIEIRWSSGTTEGGSSGSAFFTLTGSQYLLRGGLRGGSALCTNPAAPTSSRASTRSIPPSANTSARRRASPLRQRDGALVDSQRIGVGPQPRPPLELEHRLRHVVHLWSRREADMVPVDVGKLDLTEHL